MAFEQSATLAPTAIGDVEITLYSPDPMSGEPSSAFYQVQVKYSDGSSRRITGDLVPHLTQPQIDGLLVFMDVMRQKAIDEILP